MNKYISIPCHFVSNLVINLSVGNILTFLKFDSHQNLNGVLSKIRRKIVQVFSETLMDGNFRSKRKRSLDGSINKNSSFTAAQCLEIKSYGNDDLDERIIVG